MMRYRTAAGIGLVAGAIAAIFIFPIWQAWINEFQALLTGVAAVIAAYLAIRQSQSTEYSSERRHSELVRLQLRPDKLRIERGINPQLRHLVDNHGAIREASKISTSDFSQRPGAAEYHWLSAVVDILPDLVYLKSTLSRPQFRDAFHLFNGETMFAIIEIEQALDVTIAGLQRHDGWANEDDFNVAGYQGYEDNGYYDNFLSVITELNRIDYRSAILIQQLRGMAGDYGIAVS
ncbi:hypothetical protein [Rhizobium sp. 18055]|uniref:hypothetical protein n=1 Tax=Rhizobium sp. 18055 TaxID=2681403 RepID=UPI00135AD1B4|nr:hypothetical protein [Rhizobium sp. 18055]